MSIPMYRIIFSNYDDLKNPSYGGGGALAVHEVAKRLAKDFEVMVLTGKYYGSKNEVVDGVRYERAGTTILGPRAGQLFFLALLPFYARRMNYDLWIESFTPPFSVFFLPLFAKRPVIGLAHTLAGEDAERKYHLPFHLVERFGLKVYQRFIAVSEFIRQKISSIDPRAEIVVIPNGTDLSVCKKADREEKYILFLSRIEADQKGLDLLLNAYRLIKNRIGFPLYIAGAGNGKEERKLRQLIDRWGLADCVTLLGRVEKKEKEMLCSRAAIGVVPSRFESFSLAALEFLAFGLPVVAFDIPALSWLPSDAAIKVPAFDVVALARGLLTLASDAGLRRKMGDRGREVAQEYSWDSAAEKYREYILSIIGRDWDEKYPGLRREDSSAITGVVRDIVERKIPCYFISPHLDDAALSAGSLIRHLADKTEVWVLTVFSEADQGPLTLSAKRFLGKHGYNNSQEMYADRQEEDKEVWRKLGVSSAHLGFVDALWRKKDRPGLMARSFGRVFPEALYLYPTYRFHVVSGKLAPQDEKLKQDISASLNWIIPQRRKKMVFCPAGFGGHADHILAGAAVRSVFPDAILWKDYPYKVRRRDGNLYAGRIVSEWRVGLEEKQKLIFSYRSQTKQMFSKGHVPQRNEVFLVPFSQLRKEGDASFISDNFLGRSDRSYEK